MKGTVLIDLVEYLQVALGIRSRVLPPLEQRDWRRFLLRPHGKQEVAVVSVGAVAAFWPSLLIAGEPATETTRRRPTAGPNLRGVELRKRLWEPFGKVHGRSQSSC